jgi:electron transport complex protein RnfC
MRIKAFKGGIHPPGNKEYSEKKPIETVPLPKKVIIPFSQHLGAPCDSVISAGDRVKKGQKIGEGKGFVTAPVHASLSGEVVAITDFPHPSGRNLPAVEIKSDGKDEWFDGLNPTEDIWNLSPEEMREKIREAGLVGMGGAAFPTHVKLSPPKEKPIDTIIINGVECEPYLTADHRLMLEEADRIAHGIKIVMKILGVSRAFIGIEANKLDALKKMTEILANEPQIEVIKLKVKYPQGAEKQLIKAILNREVPSGGLPMDVGALVQNVGTISAIYDAVRFGIPLIERVTTVTGSAVKEAKNLKVRIGTSIRELIEFCGGFNGEVGKVIIGGPMMGVTQHSLDIPVVKGTSGILILPLKELEIEEFHPCIRCGECIQACPMKIMPNMIGNFAEKDLFEEAEKFGLMDCIECGACAYVCSARRPLVHFIRYAKAEIQAKRRKK